MSEQPEQEKIAAEQLLQASSEYAHLPEENHSAGLPTDQSQKQFRISKKKNFNLLSPEAQSLILAREEKKKAEENLQLIQQRLLSLKIQDQKNQKQIREAKKRTFSIIQSKTRAYLDKQLQEYHKVQMRELQEKKQELIKQQREQERQWLQNRQEFLKKKRDQEINFHKSVKSQVQEAIHHKMQQISLSNQEWYNQVKTHEMRLDDRKKRIEQIKLSVAEYNYKQKVDREIQEALNTQAKLDMIEKQEQIALEQLQRTQNLQKNALEEIKTLIQSPSNSKGSKVRYLFNV